jgi:hypothetical protein
MSLITLRAGVNVKDLKPNFWERFQKGVNDFGDPVDIASAFRGWVHQMNLWIGYVVLKNGKPANEPGRSSHNFGEGVDAHPKSGKKEDYDRLGECLAKYGIIQSKNPKEYWHYQDALFKAIPMTMYFIIAGSAVFFSVL